MANHTVTLLLGNKGLNSAQLERFAFNLYREWLKFASGNASHASDVKLVPHTLSYYYNLTLARTGENKYTISANDFLADIIEEGHPGFNIAERMLNNSGRDSRVIKLPKQYAAAGIVGKPTPLVSWENRSQHLRTGVPVSAIGARIYRRNATSLHKGLRPTSTDKGKRGGEFVTISRKNMTSKFFIPAHPGFHPASNLAKYAQGLSRDDILRIISRPISIL